VIAQRGAGAAAGAAARRTLHVLALGAAAAFAWCTARPAAAGHMVAIDVGHSLAAPGAISARGMGEFDFNRALALVIDDALRGAGYRTILIAAEGRTRDLVSRPRQAAAAQADFFIAVHHDSAKARFQQDWIHEGRSRKFLDDRFRGFSIFVSRNNAQWPQALRCASAIGARLIALGRRPSRYHADPLLGSSREFADEANGVHFYDNLAVLRHASMPALLFEAGVILNRDEELTLLRDDTRQATARAIRAGIADCGYQG